MKLLKILLLLGVALGAIVLIIVETLELSIPQESAGCFLENGDRFGKFEGEVETYHVENGNTEIPPDAMLCPYFYRGRTLPVQSDDLHGNQSIVSGLICAGDQSGQKYHVFIEYTKSNIELDPDLFKSDSNCDATTNQNNGWLLWGDIQDKLLFPHPKNLIEKTPITS